MATIYEAKPIVEPRYSAFTAYSLVAAVVCFPSIFLFFGPGNDPVLGTVYSIGFTVVVFNWLFVYRTGRIKDGVNILIADGGFVLLFYFARGGLGNSGLLAPFAYLPYAALLSNRRQATRWIVLFFVGCVIAVALHGAGVITMPYPPEQIGNFFLVYIMFSFCTLIFHRALERYQKEIAELDQAKSEFISIASHQLKTPPNALMWYAETLLSGDVGRLTKKQFDVVQDMQHIAEGMIDTVNALLNVSRIELNTFIAKPVPVQIEKVIHGVLEELRADIKRKKLRIKESCAKNMPALIADPGLLRVVIENLLTNAIKYTPAKGSVHVAARREGDSILFSVADTGYGIPLAEQKKIFGKMFRASNIREASDGTGLGLFVVKRIVEFAGGTIWFESAEGKGTTFFVSLPLAGMKEKTGTSKITLHVELPQQTFSEKK